MALHALKSGYILRAYRIEKLIGEGGFGLTYLAFDTHLEKLVAIKEYMPSEHAIRSDGEQIVAKSDYSKTVYDWGLNAFLNEAKTLAKFEDDNIVRIHRFFQANGTAYIVMEYCEGGCLIEQISKQQPMAEADVRRIIAAITHGLQLVHNVGILHRDIKADNIMFRLDGTPLLIDFGAARQAIGRKNKQHTTIVTPGYAPLEQYSSKGSIGPWSDIYSLSAVAYDCLIGERPPDIMNRLHDDTIINLNQQLGPSEFLAAIDWGLEVQVNKRPKNLSQWSAGWCEIKFASNEDRHYASNNTKTPLSLSSRPLSKEATRLNSHSQISTHMRNRKTVAIFALISLLLMLFAYNYYFLNKHNAQASLLVSNADKPGADALINTRHARLIAVLPLVNTKPDDDTNFLGFALADQIIAKLLYFKQITVRPSSSIRQFAHSSIDPVSIGKDLKVEYVLSGNYLKIDGQIRLNFELIEVSSNKLIWREPIEISFDNVFELQDNVAQKVSQKLGLGLSNAEFILANKTLSSNPIAYEYYLRSLSYPLTKEGDQLAIAMLENSIAIEADYAPSHVELGRRINRLALYGLGEKKDFDLAKQHLLKALSLNNSSLAALRNLATFYTETGEILKALEMTKRMLLINPDHADAYFSIAYIYRYAGILDESIAMAENAISLDPQNPKYRTLGVNYYNQGDYQGALATFKPIGNTPFGSLWQGFIHYRIGNKERALANLNRLIAMNAGDFYSYIATTIIAIITDDRSKGINALKKLEQSNVQDAEALYYWASYYAALGEKHDSLKLLRKAVNFGYFNLPYMQTDGFFDSIRGDAEFINILQLAEQKHESFKRSIVDLKIND